MLLFLPALTGLLLVASFPRASHWYLAWVAFVPLIVFVFQSGTRIHAFWGGFAAGAIENFILLIWIPPVLMHYGGLHPALAWAAYAAMVAVLGCYPGAACAAAKHFLMRGGGGYLFLLPAAWILAEYALTYWPFGGLPWLLAGYTQSNCPHIIQIADVTGIYGISFLVLWTNSVIAWIWLRRRNCTALVLPVTTAILMIVASLAYGVFSLSRWEKVRPDYGAAMLQLNISVDEPEDLLVDKYRYGYFRMADGLKSSGTDLLVFPESPTPVSFQYDSSYHQALENQARRFSLGLLFNNVRYAETGGRERYFNSAFYLDGNGSLKGVYDKIHLVPFGEYIPLGHVLSFMGTISRDVGEFNPGQDPLIIPIGGHPSNAIICFEAIFPGLVRRFCEKGSQLIVNLTNDGWYGKSSAPYQHLAIARLRAVENRRYFIRAANSGFSALIEPSGRIQTSSGLFQEAVCKGRFAFLSERTFYTRYGNVLVFLCAIILVAALVFVERGKDGICRRRIKEEINARRTE